MLRCSYDENAWRKEARSAWFHYETGDSRRHRDCEASCILD